MSKQSKKEDRDAIEIKAIYDIMLVREHILSNGNRHDDQDIIEDFQKFTQWLVGKKRNPVILNLIIRIFEAIDQEFKRLS